MIVFAIYIAIFVVSFFVVKFVVHKTVTDYTSLKTVTFGDESAVTPNRIASVISVLSIFLLWGPSPGHPMCPVSCTRRGPSSATRSLPIPPRPRGRRPMMPP
ncbi:hypothetical protein KU6B_42130 [Mameliella alba]|nr:hypothetical protein KU6B_42130 [Mameliella alba]